MTEENALHYARYAFRRREKRFALTSTAIAYVVLSTILGFGLLAIAWSAFAPLFEWYGEVFEAQMRGAQPTMPHPSVWLAVAPWYGASAVISLLLLASFEAACLRWMVRGERGGFLGLTLGADTWRVLLTYLVWFLLGIVFLVIVGALYGALFAFNHAMPSLRIVAMLIGALAPLGFLALMLWIGVRLSPAAAASIAAQKFAFFDAWSATRGRYWPMLGGFVIVMAVYFGVSFVLSAILRTPLMMWLQPALMEAAQADDMGLLLNRIGEALQSPTTIALVAAYMIGSWILIMMFYVAWYGVNAAAVAPRAPAPEAAAAPPQAPVAPTPAPPPQPAPPPVAASAPVVVEEAPPPAPTPEPAPVAEAPAAAELAPPEVSEAPAPEPPAESTPVPEAAPAEEPAAPSTEAAPAADPEKPPPS